MLNVNHRINSLRKGVALAILFTFATSVSVLNASCTDKNKAATQSAVQTADNDAPEKAEVSDSQNEEALQEDPSSQATTPSASQSSQKSKPIVALLGDSMTWISGQECDKPNGWATYLKKAGVADTIMLFARSGATWTNSAATNVDPKAYAAVVDDQNVIYNQVIRMIEFCKTHPAPDKILVYAGANDAWFDSKRPGLFNPNSKAFPENIDSALPKDFTTIDGSIRLVVAMLQKHFPDADITFLTPVQAGKIPTAKINAVGDKIEQTGKALGIPTLRGDKNIPFRHEEEAGKLRKNTTDGAHSNPGGAQLIANYLLREVFAK